MDIITLLVSLYILTKPFYFWASGLPQISDIILILAFLCILITKKQNIIKKTIKENAEFYLFIVFVLLINTIYSIYYSEISFILSSLYFIFNAIGIIVFSAIYEKDEKNMTKIRNSFILSLLIQAIVYLSGFGRYDDLGKTRYMGMFNDPNQFAYYCLLAYSFIYIINKEKKDKRQVGNLIFFGILLFLIIISGSTGMLAAAGIYILLFVIDIIRKIKNNTKKYIPKILLVILLATPMMVLVKTTPQGQALTRTIMNSSIISRVEDKITKASGNKNTSLWEERGYDRVYYYPYYIIYGAGEGKYDRFEKAHHQLELHATLPSILFCYGIIPTIIIIKWGYKKIKHLSLNELCIYIALLIESFTLVNSRQVLFWAIIVLAGYITKERGKKKWKKTQ